LLKNLFITHKTQGGIAMEKQVIISMDEFKEMEKQCSELRELNQSLKNTERAFEVVLSYFETEGQKVDLINYTMENLDSFEFELCQLIREKLT
jgi:DNA repair ATPase RecN